MSAPPPPQLKLTYFDFDGRAELVRLLFVYGGVAFEDHRVSGAEFKALKPSLPLGQVPVLQVDGVVFAQSMAIARYAAKVSGLYPRDPIQSLYVDMVSEALVELVEVITDVFFRTADETAKADKASKFFAGKLPNMLTALETMVRGDRFFLADDSASMADVQLFEVVEHGLKPFYPDFSTDAYPKLSSVLNSVRANARIAAYVAK
ncbi:Hematopoietic prostaglandin d synthase [Globisporangium polare]